MSELTNVMRVNKCATCRHFRQSEDDNKMGECRRRAPVAISHAIRIWPAVWAVEDWCGEWEKLNDAALDTE